MFSSESQQKLLSQEQPNIEDVACGLELPHSSANRENHNCFWHFFVGMESGAAESGSSGAAGSGSKRIRIGGVSIGEGAWRLVPLDASQAVTCQVTFTTKMLGAGVWSQLYNDSKLEGVTLRCRGL